jgi:heat shock protein HslJ
MSAQDFRVLPGGERMELVRPAGGGSLFFELIGPAAALPATPTPVPTQTPTPTPVPTVVIPTAAPQTPTGRVIAPDGVNVRSGPSTQYPVVGFAPFGTTGQIAGRSADGQWWAFAAPPSPTGLGWVSATYIQATNAQNVPVLPAPPLPISPTPIPTAVPPTPVPPPVATPAPVIQFSANPATIIQGQCTILSWHVENVSAVWVYPLGADYAKYPVGGVDSRQECPQSTTTYEMRVALNNGAVEYRQVTVQVQANDPLRSTEWRLNSIRSVSLVPNTAITLNFGDVNDINGNSGCNSYSGSYSVSGSTLQIRGVISTGALCGADIDNQEQSYLTTLPNAASYDFQGEQLIIRDLSGAEILRYNPAD